MAKLAQPPSSRTALVVTALVTAALLAGDPACGRSNELPPAPAASGVWLSLLFAALSGTLGVSLFFCSLVRVKNTLATMGQILLGSSTAVLTWVAAHEVLTTPSALGRLLLGQNEQWIAAAEARFVLSIGMLVVVAGLFVGAVAERLRTISVVLLSALWTILVYAPLNCVLWYSLSHPNTIMLVDWSGAHAQLAIGSFAFALVVLTGNRHGYGRIPMAPYDMGRAIGGGMIFVFALWGFCEYGATAVQPGSSSGALNAAVAGFTGLLVWAFSEHLYRGVSSTLGMISGALCGTIAVSAFAGWSPTLGAIFVGGLGSVCGFFGAVVVRRWHAVDDTLDIFAIHAVPAFVGLCAAPIFVTHPGSHWATQILSAALVSVASFAVGAGSATGLKRLGVLRVTFDEEDAGLDVTSHGETVHPPQSTL